MTTKKVIAVRDKFDFDGREITEFALTTNGIGHVELDGKDCLNFADNEFPKFFVEDPYQDARSYITDWQETTKEEAAEIYLDEFMRLKTELATLTRDALVAGIDLNTYYFPDTIKNVNISFATNEEEEDESNNSSRTV